VWVFLVMHGGGNSHIKEEGISAARTEREEIKYANLYHEKRTAQAVHEFEGEVLGEEEPGGQLGGGPVEKYGRIGDQDHATCIGMGKEG